MSTATQGRAREYRVRDHMGQTGWLQVMRSAGSKGAADLAMVHPEHGLALVQVGANSKFLGPSDRGRFTTLAELCSALPVLAHVRTRADIAYYLVGSGPASTWEAWKP